PQKIPVEKRHRGAYDDVEQTESRTAFARHHLSSQRRIAVGVLDEFLQSRIRVMNQIALHHSDFSLWLHLLVHRPWLPPRNIPLDQAQLPVGIVPAPLDPSPQV